MRRLPTDEISELVRRLGSRVPARVDGARARLAVIGARAVEALVEALESGNDTIRARAMPLLALIQDVRAREPLMAMLLDRNSELREIAARCLARFPAPDTAAALERALAKDVAESVKVAAMRALVEQFVAGQELALRPVLGRLADAREATPIRLAAFSLLPALRPAVRQGIVSRLQRDDDEEVRRRAAEVESSAEVGAQQNAAEVAVALVGLASDDYATWNDAVHRLARAGTAAVGPLLGEMRARAHDPEFCARAGLALKAMGRRRCGALAEALEQFDAPVPLQVLVEVVGALGDKSLIYRLKDLIDRLAGPPGSPGDVDREHVLQRVRAKAHLELARIGSRVAIQDLRQCLTDNGRRVEVEMLAAARLIAKCEEIPALLSAYDREDAFMRERIAEVVRAVMKREKVRRNNRVFRSLSAPQRRALDAILPAAVTSRRSLDTRPAGPTP